MLRHHQSEPLHIFGVVLEVGVKLMFADLLTSLESRLPASESPEINHRSVQRRHNHLAGQMAAKTLLQNVYVIPHDSIIMKHYPSGAPYAEAAGQRYDISIAHIAGYGAAALSLEPGCSIGIDLAQKRDMALEGLIEKTLDSVGQQMLNDHQSDFFSLWALKEAALKTWQVGMKVAIWDVRVRAVGDLFQLESEGFAPLYGTTLDLGPQCVLGVAWGEIDPEVKWRPRGLHMGC